MEPTPAFIEKHELWSDDQVRLSAQIQRRVEVENLKLIRLAWSDTHGASRAKAVSVPAFFDALRHGYNINVATFTLDAAGGRVFASFTKGGGMELDEMTGSPNLTIVPDPATFRILPWAPDIGWILCDEYFDDGCQFHFSSRQLLRRQLERLEENGKSLIVGLEVEWYLARLEDGIIGNENIGEPGTRGQALKTLPLEPGYSYHSETNLDIMQPVLSKLAETYEKLELPLRSMENEWGPGQVECTFSPSEAMRAADDYFLFRTATRQVCRRLGHFATFMCRPALKGYYSSGWHLHQSIIEKVSGQNLFMPDQSDLHLSSFGNSFLAGLLNNAIPSAIFSVPTINGYRRFQPNSLAPNRATWGFDHRGAMIRVLGGVGDPSTRIENRIGEPAANPYLYIASQIVAGLEGVESNLTPWQSDDEPYTAERPLLPGSLGQALSALQNDTLYSRHFGELFCDYFIKLKQAEIERFGEKHGEFDATETGVVTEWEQNEYFDFF